MSGGSGNSSDADRLVPLGQPVEPVPQVMLNLSRSLEGSIGIPPLRDARPQDLEVSIKLSDVSVMGKSVTGFRVFLDAPGIDQDTPITHEGYVTSAAFFPLPKAAAEPQVVGTFTFSLKKTLQKLISKPDSNDRRDLSVTIVPIGDGDAKIGFKGSALVRK